MPAGFEISNTDHHHSHGKHKVKPTKSITSTKHTIRHKHIPTTHRKIVKPIVTFLSSSVMTSSRLPTAVPSSTLITEEIHFFTGSLTPTSSPTQIAEGTILTGSSLPKPLIPASSSSSIDNTPIIIGGVIGGLVMISSIICYVLHRRIKRKKESRAMKASTVMIHDNDNDDDDDSHKQGEKWNNKKLWSTLDSTTSSKCAEMDTPPPAYYLSIRAKKRLTQESEISKQGSSLFIKQYSPQLAYSPSNHTTLQMDQNLVSPSHTLVNTRRSSSYLQHSLLEEEEQQQQQQQRRSLQLYPTLHNTPWSL